MPWRRQLPAYSPVTLRSLGAGVGAMVRPDDARGRLRALLRDEFGARDVLLLDSGTSALRLGLGAAREAGREPVALPAYSCFDVATAADGADVGAVLYDVDPRTLGPDMDSLRAALQAGARAVVVAHLYGIPVDLATVREMGRDHDALVIEDAAQGVGARFDGRPLGSHGSLAVLSFGRGKGWTGGGGGALLANDEAGERLLERAGDRMAASGATADDVGSLVRLTGQWLFGQPSLFGLPASIPSLAIGETRYRTPWVPGRLAASSAGALVSSLQATLAEAEARRANASRLSTHVTPGWPGEAVRLPEGATGGFLRLPWVASSGSERRRLLAPPALRLGLMPGYPKTLAALRPFGDRIEAIASAGPGAETLARRLVTLPTHSRLTEEDFMRLEGWTVRRDPGLDAVLGAGAPGPSGDERRGRRST